MGDYLLEQGTRLEDFHLIVETVGHRQTAHTLQDIGSSAGSSCPAFLGIAFLDQNGRSDVIDWCLIAQVDKGQDQTAQHAGHKPRPVGQILEKDGIQIDAFLMLRLQIILFFVHIISLK